MFLTFNTLIQNSPLLVLAFILGALIFFYPELIIAKKYLAFTFAIPAIVFVPSIVLLGLGLSDTSWSVFSRTLLGGIGISLSLGIALAGLICMLFIVNKSKEEE